MQTTPPSSATPPVARPRRWRLAWAALGTSVAVLGGALVGLWHWSAQEGSLATALNWGMRWAPGALKVDGVQGSLRLGGQVASLSWTQPDVSLHIQGFRLTLPEGAWLQLWQQRQLLIAELHADSVVLDDQRPPSPSAPPTQLHWPWLRGVQVNWSLPDLRLQGTTPVALAAQGQYAYRHLGQIDTPAQHTLDVTQLSWAQGQYTGQLQLTEHTLWQLKATIKGTVPVPMPTGRSETLQVQATAQGDWAEDAAPWHTEISASTAQGDAGPTLQAQAGVQPWNSNTPVPQASAQWQQLDLAWLWPQAPQTRLRGTLDVSPDGTGASARLTAHNSLSGPLDKGRLPIEQIDTRLGWQGGKLTVSALRAKAAGGEIALDGHWQTATNPSGSASWAGTAQLQRLRPDGVWSTLPAEPMNAQGRADSQGTAIRSDITLSLPKQSDKPVGRFRWLWSPTADDNQLLDVQEAWVRWNGLSLDAKGSAALREQRVQGQVTLDLDGNQLSWQGHISPKQGQGQWALQLPRLNTLQRTIDRWASLPGLGPYLVNHKVPALQGQLSAQGDWQGGWTNPVWTASAKAQQLEVGTTPLKSPLLNLKAQGSATQAQWRWDGQHRWHNLPVSSRASGQVSQSSDWLLRWDTIHIDTQASPTPTSRWSVQLAQPWTVRATPGTPQWSLDGGQAQWQVRQNQGPAALWQWSALSWAKDGLRTQGQFQQLPLAWLDAAHSTWQQLQPGQAATTPPLAQAGVQGDLVWQGNWQLHLAPDASASSAAVQIERQSGDVLINLPGLSAVQRQAGVQTALLNWQLRNNDSSAKLLWRSARLGNASGEWRTQLQLGMPLTQAWPANTPQQGQLQADLPDLSLWQALAPPGWRGQGRLRLQAQLSGTQEKPDWSGELIGEALGMTSAVNGLRFEQGELHARLQGQTVFVDKLRIHGMGGAATGGTLQASGEARWQAQTDGRMAPLITLQVNAERLRISNRPDQKLSISGQTQARLQGQQLHLRGDIRADEALFILPDDLGPQLGSDVVVRGGRQSTTATSGQRLIPDVLLTLDLGDKFTVRGRGLQTRLAGQLQLRSTPSLPTPRMHGEVRTVGGTYRAYGQELRIDTGVLRFAGPFDDPTLDILALRAHTNASIDKVGVKVTGSAQAPRAALVSEPEVPDSEKLAWLVLGRPASGTGAEAAILQQAALALLLGQGGGPGADLALRVGLDELSLRGPNTQADGSTEAASLTLGKRFSDKLYLSYEQSLGGTLGTLSVLYDLSRRLTLRAQTGAVQAIDLIFTIRYD